MDLIIGGGNGGAFPEVILGGANNATAAGGTGQDGRFAGGGGGAGAVTGGAGGIANPSLLGGNGGTGGVHGHVGSASVTGRFLGTQGGQGGDGFGLGVGTGFGDGGGGGGGGYGAVLNGTGDLGTLSATLLGGDGGAGGKSEGFLGGGGGRGGIGLYFEGTGQSVDIASTVRGGDGGIAGKGRFGAAVSGDGGEGIRGRGVTITLLADSEIAGGFSGNGVRANAIFFEGGTNVLEVQGGTIFGNVVAAGTDDTFRLSGDTGGTFDMSKIYGFETLGSAGDSVWTLAGTNSDTQTWTASSGKILVAGSLANTTFDVGQDATLGGTGTVGAVNADGTIGPGNGRGVLNTGDFTLGAGGTLEIEIAGAAGAKVDQLKVTGTVTLAGELDLALLKRFAPGAGDAFVIIDNDDADAVAGSFAGLAEGATFMVGAKSFRITYQGGDGNDVVLTAASPAPEEAANKGATLAEGASRTITAAQLRFADTDQSAGNIVYILTSAATSGTLLKNGTAIGLGDSFTQKDIDDGKLTYRHDGGETASDSFGFSVSDGQGNSVAGQSFAFTVTAVNDAPTGIVATPISGTGKVFPVAENATGAVIATLSTADPDDTVFTYTVDDARFEVVNSQLKLKSGVSLDFEQASSVIVRVTATDSGALKVTRDVAITVTDVDETIPNSAPVLDDPNEDLTLQAGQPLSILLGNGHFRDPDGTDLDYAISVNGGGLPAWLTFDTETGRLTGTPDASDVGSYTIRITASDGSLSATDEFTLVVPIPGAAADTRGNRRSEVLVGDASDNVMDGRGGNDKLTGNDGADTFVLDQTYGRDVVLDFHPEDGDIIDLSGAIGISGYRDLIKNHLFDTGDDIRIRADDGSTLVIRDFEPADLTKDMFLF